MAKESVESLCKKAQKSLAAGEYDQAKQFYLQALGLRSDSPDVHYGLATVCFLQSDLASAAYHFKEVTRLDPLRAGAYINLGAVYNRLNQLDDAIPVLRRGIQLDINRAEGYYNLGLVYKRKGQPELAIQAYREATRVNPRMADAHYNLGNLYTEREQYGLAIAHYRQAIDLKPDWEKAMRGLEQAEAAQEQIETASASSRRTGRGATQPITMSESADAPIDPERLVDPHVHGAILTTLHRATIESESQGRHFLKILESEIEPAIKVLSSCLLYPDSSATELEHCAQKFESAVASMRAAQSALESSMDRVRSLGDQLLKH
ncbi:MAG: tetratricopeptide repeat protein [Planctomycetes bacterium]|nr:tetratricopeptide repeat protein [Planctomycetota bacterium]